MIGVNPMAKKRMHVLFQGDGYRIMSGNSDYNVTLELLNERGNYSFFGYYENIAKSLRALIVRDVFIDRAKTYDVKTYLDEVERVKNKIFRDIDKHFEN